MSHIKISPENKVVFISGANRGIGKAIALEVLDNGAKKVYAGTRNLEALHDLKQNYGDKLIPVHLDVTNDTSIAEAVAIANDVEVLFNNAGVFQMGGFFSENALKGLKVNLDVNVWGVVKLTQAFIHTLKQKELAAIVNLSSVVGLASIPTLATYSATKATVHSITQGMRGELAQENILVMGVYPGAIDTDMNKGIPMEKESPANVAKEIIQALRAGQEDVFPDPMSKQVGQGYLSDPKSLERDFRQFTVA